MTTPPAGRRLAALLVLVLALGSCSGGGQQADGDGGKEPGGPSSQGDGAQAGQQAADDLIASSGEADDLGGPGGEGGADAPSGIDDSKPVRRSDVPLEGRYWYDYSEVGGGTTERIIEVIDAASGDGWLRQLRTFATHSVATRSLDVWLADEFYREVEQRARADEIAAACVWRPGFTLLALPLAVGSAWKSDSTCTNDASERRRTLDAKVTGRRTEVVGDKEVDVFVVEQTVITTTEVEATTPLVTVETATTTDLYSADRNVLVESSGVKAATVNGAPQGTPQNFTLRLRALEPDPLGTPLPK